MVLCKMKTYTIQEYFIELNQEVIFSDPEMMGNLYKKRFVNRKGVPKGSSQTYTEILAKHLYANIVSKQGNLGINVIQPTPKAVKQAGPIHDRKNVEFSDYKNGDRVRNEENIAKQLFSIKAVGTYNGVPLNVIDYQVPVNRRRGYPDGKIDLILESGSSALIGELKDDYSKESLLRAVLEVETYFEKIEGTGLLQEYYSKNNIIKALLLFKETRPYDEYFNVNFQETKKLLKALNIVVFEVIDKNPNIKIIDGNEYKNKKYSIKNI